MADFKEYRSAFLDRQDDLRHYGVKGMKWRHNKRSPGEKPLIDTLGSGYVNLDEKRDGERIKKMKEKIRRRLEHRKKYGTVYHS